jgi:putative membrane protein
VSPNTDEPGGGVPRPASTSDSTMLAVERTRLAYERTMMAWVRTATSLISFGFTIYKFFQYLRQEGGFKQTAGLLGSREFGLMMILLGLASLVLAAVQHRGNLKRLRARYTEVPYSMAAVLAILVALFGVLTLVALIFRQ